ILDYLNDIFLIGLDYSRPAILDVFLEGATERYRLFAPLKDLEMFRDENLHPLNIDTRRIATRGLYRLRDDKTKELLGYMRTTTNGYAILSEERDEVALDLPNPAQLAPAILNQKYEGALTGRNRATSPADQRARHQLVEKDRPDRLAALKQWEDETADQFALRKLFFNHQVDEYARLYAEGEELFLGAKIAMQNKQGWAALRVKPIAGSAFAAAVESVGRRPSDFAPIPRREDPVLSLRINHPIDPMRQENLLEMTALMRDIAGREYDSRRDLTAEQRESSKQAANLFFDMIDGGTRGGLLDGFIEAYRNAEGQVTLYGAVHAPEGTDDRALEILELLPQAKPARKVEMNFDQQGDVAIHKVALAPDEYVEIQEFFGREPVYVGTSPDRFWIAGGQGALEDLKTAIEQVAAAETGQPDPVFLDVVAQMAPWTELFHQLRGETGNPDLRQLAVEAFKAGQDVTTLKLERVNGHIEGRWELQPGILRFFAKV
ncbi:MAG: hypothetical protein ACREJB_17455, partial [Planctomycetaceae bacterium]